MTTEHRTFGQLPKTDGQFQDRRSSSSRSSNGLERRQFSDSHADLSAEAAELGRAIDQYKLLNRRKYITYEEMLAVMKELGYSKQQQAKPE